MIRAGVRAIQETAITSSIIGTPISTLLEGSVASAIDDEDDLDGAVLKQFSAYGVENLG
jgi:hypothetical protein